MTEPDFYSEVDDFTRALANAGRRDVAERLDNAIARGATGSEILFGLRWELHHLLKEDPPEEPRLREWATEIYQTIQAALPDPPLD